MNEKWHRWVWLLIAATVVGTMVVYWFQPPPPTPLGVLAPAGNFALTNQLGEPVTQRSLWGEVVVANVIFTRCPIQCHRLSQLMSRVQAALPPKGVRLVSLTADPSFDTPEVLGSYGKRHGANSDHWWFLTGSKQEIYRYAISDLKFNLLENPEPSTANLENLFIHSTDFAILDKSGRLRCVVHGLDEDEAEKEIIARVKQLLN
jgi:protein SCO1/2